MPTKDGGPAFPRAEGPNTAQRDGMSLRDHFAGIALSCLLTSDTQVRPSEAPIGAGIAAWSYAIADAMIAERGKTQP